MRRTTRPHLEPHTIVSTPSLRPPSPSTERPSHSCHLFRCVCPPPPPPTHTHKASCVSLALTHSQPHTRSSTSTRYAHKHAVSLGFSGSLQKATCRRRTTETGHRTCTWWVFSFCFLGCLPSPFFRRFCVCAWPVRRLLACLFVRPGCCWVSALRPGCGLESLSLNEGAGSPQTVRADSRNVPLLPALRNIAAF